MTKKLIAIAVLAALPGFAGASDQTELNAMDKSGIEAASPAVNIPTPRLAGQEKIVGGVEAVKGEFPFIVSLRGDYGGHFCGGSLIKKDWVLTAAHCIPGGIKKVVIGLHDQSQAADAETLEVDNVIAHPDYNKQPQDYDFALLHLKGESKFPPAALNRRALSGKTSFVTAGWGYTMENGDVENVLRKVTVPMVSAKACSKAYPGSITDRMVCAGFAEGGKDSCQGDSGGPLLTGSGDARVLAGVVSWGEGCARPNKYGVYSKVSSVIDWIDGIAK
ncbi:MAG: serine protease [Elusimicrobiota bacterium]|nr:serine protease [Elusimicrobiota bacterium]